MSRRRWFIGLVFLLAAAAGVGAWFLRDRVFQPHPGQPDAPAARPPGKLVVLVVFDQMRGDYLARWADQFGPGGFERMKKDGVWFSECHLPYACSSTAPGHASIATGAPPSVHGIIENDWYEPKKKAHVYCVEPARPYDLVPPPPDTGKASRGADTGFSPDNLLAETVGDKLQTATGGKGRVVSLSIKDRTAVLMGGKKPKPDSRDPVVYCFDTRDGLFHTGTYYRGDLHPWAAEFNAAGKVNAWAGTDWTRLRPDLDYDRLAGRDDAPGEDFGVVERDAAGETVFGQKRVFPHPFRARSTDPKKQKTYYTCVETSPAGNELLAEFVKAAVAGEHLGAGGAADLLCVSFSSIDLIGHRWGPDSWEVLDATLRADRVVADLLKYLDETVGPDRYTVVLTADHGVCPLPEQKRIPGAERKSLNDIVPDLFAALEETFGAPPAGPTRWLVSDKDAGTVWPWVHLNHEAIKGRGLDPAAVADYAAQWIGNRPFMMAGFTRKHVETNTLPPLPPAGEKDIKAAFEKVKLAYYPDRCGDLIAVPRPGVLITGYETGTNHGTPHAYDTHVPVVLYGAGVPALGKRDGRVSSLIVAPALARALGIDPPAAAKEPLPAELAEAK